MLLRVRVISRRPRANGASNGPRLMYPLSPTSLPNNLSVSFGAAFFTGDMLALERAFTKIAKELRTQYLITYRPSNDRYDGSYRRVEVRLAAGHENMKLRTKRGYKAVNDSLTTR